MNTIEERAYQHYPIGKCNDIIESMKTDAGWDGYILGATDQDPISRADEKEKVLNEVCEWLRNYEPLWQSNCIASDLINKLRQAMEE